MDSSVLFLFQDFRNSYTVYRYHLFDCIYMSWWIIEMPFSSCTDHTGQWGRRKESTGLRLKWLPTTPIGSRIPWLNCEQSCLKGHQPKWNGSSKWRIVKRWTVLAALGNSSYTKVVLKWKRNSCYSWGWGLYWYSPKSIHAPRGSSSTAYGTIKQLAVVASALSSLGLCPLRVWIWRSWLHGQLAS